MRISVPLSDPLAGVGRRPIGGASTVPVATDWHNLRRGLAGKILLPEEAGYDEARRPAISRFDQIRPIAVVRCAGTLDVVAVLRFLRARRLPAVVRSGGHCFVGRSSSSGVVVDVGPMREVNLDGDLLSVGAGASLGQVADVLHDRRRFLPIGCGKTVGIAGLTLGGGLGVLGRAMGLTCDHLRSAQVVTTDGRVMECSTEQHPDLFWALRGAGAVGLGVVTRLDFATRPAEPVTGFRVTWPLGVAPDLIVAWQAEAPRADPRFTANLKVSVGDGTGATVSGVMIGDRQQAQAQVARLTRRISAAAVTETYVHGDLPVAKRHLDSDQISAGVSMLGSSNYFRRALPAPVVEELVRGLRVKADGATKTLDFVALGGAYRRVPRGGTAYAHRAARFLLHQTVESTSAASRAQAAREWLQPSAAAVREWSTGGVYPNFPEADLPKAELAYWGRNLPRVRSVQAVWNPDRLLTGSSGWNIARQDIARQDIAGPDTAP